jgi:putative glutamine amidotransferase
MDFRADKKGGSAVHYLPSEYCDAIQKARGIPLLIPPFDRHQDIDRVLELVDGVVLTGGNDLDPRNDGYQLHPSARLMEPKREQFDRHLCKMTAERKIPLFAVGVGMQLLNVSFGGTLFLHIPDDRPKALPHWDYTDPLHAHPIRVKEGSIMEKVYKCNPSNRYETHDIRVLSCHHMAVDDVARGFRVTARCPDGIVEAIESNTEWFAFGTQFHPASEIDFLLFEEFLVGVEQNMAVAA